MELMSSLLFCTFVAMVLQVRAESLIKTDWYTIYNDSLKNRQRPSTHNKILLNINAPPLVNVISEVQAVFAEAACRNCITCMEKAIKAYRINSHLVDTSPSPEELQSDVLLDQHKFESHLQKRYVTANDTTIIKKIKTKKNKTVKAVTVTKYNVDRQLYALKIRETTTQTSGSPSDVKSMSTTCLVYNVKNEFLCNSPEGEILLSVAKQKANKKSKREKEKVKTTTTPKIVTFFKKREVDHSQVPENFMPSIEDIY